jgi:hypothetical protein
MFTCMEMEKWVLLKLLQELEGINENGEGGKFIYSIFDIL